MRAAWVPIASALLLAPLPASALEPLAVPDGPDEVEDEEAAPPEPEMVFPRADDLAALRGQSFWGQYGIESGKNWGDFPQPFGIRHRIRLAYGVTDWLKLSVQQSAKNKLDTNEFRVGAFAPQLRLSLAGMIPGALDSWPLDVSTYAGPRVRIMGRRDPSVVWGLGTNTPEGPLHFTLNEGLEVTIPNEEEGTQTNFGPRYDAGVGYEVGWGFLVGAEVWGHVAWTRGGFEEQEHHAGPTFLYAYDFARFGLSLAAGFREQVRESRQDMRGMFTLGLEI